MLLRSSSSPALGSLNHHQRHPLCCTTSPFSSDSSGVRRTRSDGNLNAALSPPRRPIIRSSTRRHDPSPGKPPSFFIYGGPVAAATAGDGEVPDLEDQEDRDREEDERRDSFGEPLKVFGLWGLRKDQVKAAAATNPPLFLARGLGIDRVGSGLLTAGGDYDLGGGGGGSCSVLTGCGGEGEKSETEMNYRKMVDEDPNNAMLLRNYAEFLYEAKGDLKRAEEYFSRAVLVEPGDGEILSRYAKLVWERHRDEERASSYFRRAVQASPQDSHVLAAYAGFLWALEDENGGYGEVAGGARDFGGAGGGASMVVDHGASSPVGL